VREIVASPLNGLRRLHWQVYKSRQSDLTGWFSLEDQEVLKRLLEAVTRPGMRVLEVGSWKGLSTTVIGRVVKEAGGHAFCVDTWAGADVEIGTGHREVAYKDILSVFRRNMQLLQLDDVVHPLNLSSALAAKILSDRQFDLVFLDGDHTYDAVSADIVAFLPKLATDGIICGHDCPVTVGDLPAEFLEDHKNEDIAFYGNRGYHCGVIRAVHDAFGAGVVVEGAAVGSEASRTSIWWHRPSISVPGT
jgi:hypothetical protein